MADDRPPASEDVYFNGGFTTADRAEFGASDHGVLYGLGFFETFRTAGGRPHAWHRHQARLRRACAIAGIVLPPTFLASDVARLAEVVRRLLRLHRHEDAVFRYTVTAGVPTESGRAIRYLQPAELLTMRPLPPVAADGIVLRVLQLPRDSGEWLPRPKSLNFANALLGGHELRRRAGRPDDEGLFLDRSGCIVEAVRCNVAWLAGGRWHYPDPALGAVPGTGLQWFGEQVPAAVPARAKLEQLLAADAMIVINAVRGVTAIRELWDASDRAVLREWVSRPEVIALRRQWDDSLRATFQPT